MGSVEHVARVVLVGLMACTYAAGMKLFVNCNSVLC